MSSYNRMIFSRFSHLLWVYILAFPLNTLMLAKWNFNSNWILVNKSRQLMGSSSKFGSISIHWSNIQKPRLLKAYYSPNVIFACTLWQRREMLLLLIPLGVRVVYLIFSRTESFVFFFNNSSIFRYNEFIVIWTK